MAAPKNRKRRLQRGGTRVTRTNPTTPGTGRAADCYPVRNGTVYIPSASAPIWKTYADVVREHGLVAGYYWPMKDSPHCERPAG